jgi:hypothetical protein
MKKIFLFLALLIPSICHAALTDNLVAYWKLDEASGTRADSVGSNTLTDINTVTSATGKINNAGQFTKSNNEALSIANNTDVQLGDIDWTVTAWVYLDSEPGQMDIISKATGFSTGTREFELMYLSDRFVLNTGGFISPVATADNFGAVSTSTWYFIVAWHDAAGNTINISVNNGTANSTATSGSFGTQGSGEFTIGSYNANQTTLWTYDGRIDEVGLWKRVLTSQERTDLYNSGAGFAYPFTATPTGSPVLILKGNIAARGNVTFK